jgi:ligand-binding sensor domain-containing protein/class 3 adenylate cyclase
MNNRYYQHIFLGFLVLITSVFFSINSFTQNYIFQVYDQDNGLPQVQVIDVFIDSRGYLWAATSGGGLGKFDGISFTNYSTEHGLGSSMVLCVFEDSEGSIWAGTYEGGLNRYNGKGFINYRYNSEINTINAIAEDKNGNLLLAAQSNGVFIFDGLNFEKFKLPENFHNANVNDIIVFNNDYWFAVEDFGIIRVMDDEVRLYNQTNNFPAKSPEVFFIDSNGRLWIGSDAGLTLFADEKFINYGEKSGLLATPILDIKEDFGGNIWVGTFGEGVGIFDGNKFSHISKDQGLTNNYIRALEIDDSGGIWIGTNGGGLCRFGGKMFTVLDITAGLSNNIVISLYEDKNNNVWFSNVGAGVTKWDGKNFSYYIKNDGLADNIVYGIFQDSKGRMWFAHQTAGVTVFDGKTFKTFSEKDGLAFNFATVVKEDSRGNIWISTRKGISRFDGKSFKNFKIEDGLIKDKSYHLVIDKNDNIWSACESGVLNLIKQYYNKRTGKTTYELKSYTPEISYVNTFSSLAISKDGSIWIGSFGNGLFHFDGQTFINYKVENGITSNHIYSLLFDKNDNLWMGHLRGLDKITIAGDTVQNVKFYSKELGFVGVETALNSIIERRNGEILVGTAKGVMIYNPEYDVDIVSEPRTQIKSLQVFFEDIDFTPYAEEIDNRTFLPKNLVLNHKLNHLTFDFIGIKYSTPEKVLYSWILEGFDKNWTPINKSTLATYTNLPPGSYKFKVVAYNPFTNIPSAPAEFSFVIKPPFYKTITFFILSGLSLFLLIFLTVFYRFYSLKKRNIRLEKLVNRRTRELQKEKDNVEKQRNKILAQNIEISRKTVELEESNEELRIKTEDLESQRSEAEAINAQLKIEKRKSDDLLLNILPLEIANELKANGKANVKQFSRATVMFTDFSDFTNISKSLSPIELINRLDDYFSAFDNAIEQYRIEKIKTIGDAYMCAGGIPVPNMANPIEVVLSALDIQHYLRKEAEISKSIGEKPFNARIGIHTGKIITGIIGKKKIAYDIWGETVNLASRMESASETGKINISGVTYEYIKPFFETFHRGKISLKNSPSLDMYYVLRIKPEYSADEEGVVPNDKLYAAIGEVDAS